MKPSVIWPKFFLTLSFRNCTSSCERLVFEGVAELVAAMLPPGVWAGLVIDAGDGDCAAAPGGLLPLALVSIPQAVALAKPASVAPSRTERFIFIFGPPLRLARENVASFKDVSDHAAIWTVAGGPRTQ